VAASRVCTSVFVAASCIPTDVVSGAHEGGMVNGGIANGAGGGTKRSAPRSKRSAGGGGRRSGGAAPLLKRPLNSLSVRGVYGGDLGLQTLGYCKMR
jgi:hypothetical protein